MTCGGGDCVLCSWVASLLHLIGINSTCCWWLNTFFPNVFFAHLSHINELDRASEIYFILLHFIQYVSAFFPFSAQNWQIAHTFLTSVQAIISMLFSLSLQCLLLQCNILIIYLVCETFSYFCSVNLWFRPLLPSLFSSCSLKLLCWELVWWVRLQGSSCSLNQVSGLFSALWVSCCISACFLEASFIVPTIPIYDLYFSPHKYYIFILNSCALDLGICSSHGVWVVSQVASCWPPESSQLGNHSMHPS